METRVAVPLRAGGGGKKMRKRKELDALGRRCRRGGGGVSSQDGLLSESTDDQDQEQDVEDSWRSKRRPAETRVWPRRRACRGVLRACTLVLVFACVVATTTVMWLFIDVREQASFLRNQLDQVVAGSQGVPEALQKCHSMSKQLQQNQTALFDKLNELTIQLNNFTSQVKTISNSLNRVEDRFKTSPELIKVPHDLETLTTNVATFGSQMQDLVGTVAQLKEASGKLSLTTDTLQNNVSSIRQEMSSLSVLPSVASPAAPSVDVQFINATISALRANVSLINDTLSKKIQWAQEDLASHQKSIVGLQERNENVSTRVTSLQNECSAQATQLTNLTSTISQVSSQAQKQEERWTQVSSRLNELSATCDRLETNNTQLTAQLFSLKKALVSDNPASFTSSVSPSTLSSATINDSLKES